MSGPAPLRKGATATAAQGRSWLWAQGMACGLLLAVAAPLLVILAVLLAPAALGALTTTGENGRRLGGVMLVYGAAAALPWLGPVWHAARDWALALELLSAMRLVGVCWAAQAGAWLLCEIIPVIARLVLEARVQARAGRLRDARGKLEIEWGLEREEAPPGE